MDLAAVPVRSNLYPNDGSDSVLLISSPLCWVTGVWQCLNGVVFGLTRVFTTFSDELTLLSTIDKYQVCPGEEVDGRQCKDSFSHTQPAL